MNRNESMAVFEVNVTSKSTLTNQQRSDKSEQTNKQTKIIIKGETVWCISIWFEPFELIWRWKFPISLWGGGSWRILALFTMLFSKLLRLLVRTHFPTFIKMPAFIVVIVDWLVTGVGRSSKSSSGWYQTSTALGLVSRSVDVNSHLTELFCARVLVLLLIDWWLVSAGSMRAAGTKILLSFFWNSRDLVSRSVDVNSHLTELFCVSRCAIFSPNESVLGATQGPPRPPLGGNMDVHLLHGHRQVHSPINTVNRPLECQVMVITDG